jgi:hypothetical protein
MDPPISIKVIPEKLILPPQHHKLLFKSNQVLATIKKTMVQLVANTFLNN